MPERRAHERNFALASSGNFGSLREILEIFDKCIRLPDDMISSMFAWHINRVDIGVPKGIRTPVLTVKG